LLAFLTENSDLTGRFMDRLSVKKLLGGRQIEASAAKV
jgi:hypothetical protein